MGGGWYWPGQTLQDLQDEMRRHLDAGYTMVKMKVGGLPLDQDCRRIEAVLEVLGAEAKLAVDANGKFDRAESLAYAKALAPFRLRWFEEPCDPLDFALYAEIAHHYEAPLATGENLYSTQDVQNLVRFGGLRPDRDIVQVDPPAGLRDLPICAHHRDAGARRLDARLAVSPRRQPDVAFHRGRVRVGRGGVLSRRFRRLRRFRGRRQGGDGAITLSDRPGIGFEGQAALYAVMKELAA